MSALDRGAADHLRKSGDVNELAARVGAARRQRELIEQADKRLYEAKAGGRDAVRG